MARFFNFWLHPSNPHFNQLIPGGFLTLTHILWTALLMMVGFFLYRYVVQLTPQKRQIHFQWLAVILVLLELTRMIWNVVAADAWYAKDVFPLYTCGIFVIIFPFYAFNTRMKKWTEGFIALGAMLAGSIFLIFPSTGLIMFPLWHINTLISSVMHVSMAVIGAVLFFDAKRILKPFDFYSAMVVVLVFASISWIYNWFDPEANFFFIKVPFAETPLQLIYDWFGQPWYGFIVVMLHALEGFIMYGLHQRYIVQ